MDAEQQLRKARETHAGLLSARAAAEQRLEALAAERSNVAFSAHTRGGKAREQLDRLNDLYARESSEISSISEALTQSDGLIRECEADVACEQAHARAQRARQLIPELRTAGRAAEDTLEEFGEAMRNFYALGDELRSLGVGGPNRDLVRVNVTRSIQKILYPIGLSSEALPGAINLIKSIDELIDSWATNIEGTIARQLGEDAEAA